MENLKQFHPAYLGRSIISVIYSAKLKVGRYIPDWYFASQAVTFMAKTVERDSAWRSDFSNLRWAGPEDLNLLVESGYSKEFLQKQFSLDKVAILFARDRVIQGISWYSYKHHLEYPWLRVDLLKDELWNYDVWICQNLRGLGLVHQIFDFAHSHLSASGGGRIFCSIDSLNRSSLRAYSKAGYHKVGQIFYVRVRDWVFVWAGRFPMFGRGRITNPIILRIKENKNRTNLEIEFPTDFKVPKLD
jgi:hypothetical protein